MTEATPPAGRGRHTPGPWFLIEHLGGGYTIQNQREGGGVLVLKHARDCTATEHANLRLIAAAPALLEALTHLERTFGEGHATLEQERNALEQARAAIALTQEPAR